MKKRSKKAPKKKKGSKFIFFFSLIFIGIAGFFLYDHYRTHYYDSSLDGSEIIEAQHKTIPEDVKQEIARNQKINEQSSSVFAAKTFRVPILMYHYVEYVADQGDKTRISLNTTPYTLEEQIKTLKEAGYTFITNAELAEVLNGRMELMPKSILLTFDDGYRDFYADVFPILKKYNVKATNYVIAGFLNWQNHLTDDEVKEIANSGLVEIGAHTVHHAWLKGRNSKNISEEVLESKTVLEKKFNIKVVSFAYPFGAFDKPTLDEVKKAGYKSATSTIPGIEQNKDNLYFLSRLRPGGRTGQALLDWLNQNTFKEYN